MEDILQQLFDGELRYNFTFPDEVPAYHAARTSIREQEAAFLKGLTPGQRTLYESLMQQSLENEHLLTVEAFRRGFSAAVQMMTASL